MRIGKGILCTSNDTQRRLHLYVLSLALVIQTNVLKLSRGESIHDNLVYVSLFFTQCHQPS